MHLVTMDVEHDQCDSAIDSEKHSLSTIHHSNIIKKKFFLLILDIDEVIQDSPCKSDISNKVCLNEKLFLMINEYSRMILMNNIQ